MTKRAFCKNCHFLIGQCVCEWVPLLSTHLKVVILQDPKEAKHAKNTVSLLTLGLPSVRCLSTQDLGALARLLADEDQAKWRLVFPCDRAEPIETLPMLERSSIEGVILIDATWRKAKKLFFTEPMLCSLKAVCFDQPPAGQYAIRKSPYVEALSTLEACAYVIEQITQENMQPLRDFMMTAQAWQWRHQPVDHRHD